VTVTPRRNDFGFYHRAKREHRNRRSRIFYCRSRRNARAHLTAPPGGNSSVATTMLGGSIIGGAGIMARRCRGLQRCAGGRIWAEIVFWQGGAEFYNGSTGNMVGNVDSWQGGVDIVMRAILLHLHCGKTSGSIIVPIPTTGSSEVSSDSRSQSMKADSLITRSIACYGISKRWAI
jgi:hypothetical protein